MGIACSLTGSAMVKEGDALPSSVLQKVGPTTFPEHVNIADYCRGRRVVLAGCPGAFGNVCSNVQVQGFLSRQDDLQAKGVSEVVVFSVNDGVVMTAWAREQGIAGTIVRFMADLEGSFTRSLGLVLEDEETRKKYGRGRCKRCALIVQEGIVQRINIASYSDDPLGERHPQMACVEKVLSDLEALSDSFMSTREPLSPKLVGTKGFYGNGNGMLLNRALLRHNGRPTSPLSSISSRSGSPINSARPLLTSGAGNVPGSPMSTMSSRGSPTYGTSRSGTPKSDPPTPTRRNRALPAQQ
mmetsp:Transcript_102193/g.256204  ORF Transcript_102193/g.256204 Transcript_102193/m.256204 type:complete len:298 (+) Transcript_102193:74-967(+)